MKASSSLIFTIMFIGLSCCECAQIAFLPKKQRASSVLAINRGGWKQHEDDNTSSKMAERSQDTGCDAIQLSLNSAAADSTTNSTTASKTDDNATVPSSLNKKGNDEQRIISSKPEKKLEDYGNDLDPLRGLSLARAQSGESVGDGLESIGDGLKSIGDGFKSMGDGIKLIGLVMAVHVAAGVIRG